MAVTYDTASQVVSDAAVELGLVTADIANPWASTDQNILQLGRLLKRVGRKLVRAHPWTHLQKEHTFTTVDGTANYAPPDDFARFIEDTHFDRSNQLPLGGGLIPQDWQWLKSVSATGTVYNLFRTKLDAVYIHPTPGTFDAAYEYISRYWVRPTGQTAPTSDTPSAGTDTLHFDPHLLVCALKLAFKEAKGFDASAAQKDYDEAFAMATGGDGSAPTINISPSTLDPIGNPGVAVQNINIYPLEPLY